MRPTSISRACFLLAAALAAPAFAGDGWQRSGRPKVAVKEHVFDHVRVTANGCNTELRVYFTAPADGYADDRNAVRNHYRFRAQVRLKDGHVITTNLFNNREPGRRMYRYQHDTSADGCWAKAPASIVKLDVTGCRGAHCSPERL